MKVVPEDVSTAPLEGASREPQSTTVGRYEIDEMDNCTTYIDKLMIIQLIIQLMQYYQ